MAPMDGERGPPIISQIERSSARSSIILPNGPDSVPLIRNEHDAKVLAALELTIKKANNIYTKEDQVAFNERLEAQLAIDRTILSPQTLRHQHRVRLIWRTVLNLNGVLVSDNEIFVLDHIKAHARKFIHFVLDTIVPQVGYKVASSRTLIKYFYSFVIMIVRDACHINTDGRWERAGYFALQGGLVQKMKEDTLLLIKDKGLDRHSRAKDFYGKYELHLIFAVMLESSEPSRSKRIIVLQIICQALLVYYVTLRPGSMGATSNENRDWGMYPKLGSVQIFREGYLSYSIKFEILNYKGYMNTATGYRRIVFLTSVTKPHNVLFDITLVFIALLWTRGDLETKYETLDELLADESPQLMIDPSKHDMPLFLMPSEAGHGFVDPPKAASNRTASAAFARYAAKAGLSHPGGSGFYNIRRASANAFGQDLGRSIAQTLLNHSEAIDTFDRYYDRGLLNYDLVKHRDARDDALPPTDWQEMDDRIQYFTGAAIECMTRRLTDHDTRPNNPLDKPQIYTQQHPDIIEIEDLMRRRWSVLLTHFEHDGRFQDYVSKANLTRLSKGVEDENADFPMHPTSSPAVVKPSDAVTNSAMGQIFSIYRANS